MIVLLNARLLICSLINKLPCGRQAGLKGNFCPFLCVGLDGSSGDCQLEERERKNFTARFLFSTVGTEFSLAFP